MPLPNFTVKMLKDGRKVARFRDSQGLVRTSTSGIINWTRTEQIKKLVDYGIVLQIEQARQGIGSDGQPMPALLTRSGKAVFAGTESGRAKFARKTYADRKAARGLQPIRDLYGFGKGGHMLDAIRVNYLDDRRATFNITTKVSRDKARGNERKAPWWGWSPQSIRKMREYCAELFGTGMAEQLFSLGLIGVSALAYVKARTLRRVA